MVDKNCKKTVKMLMGDTIDDDTLHDLFTEASEAAQELKRGNSEPVSKGMRKWLDERKEYFRWSS